MKNYKKILACAGALALSASVAASVFMPFAGSSAVAAGTAKVGGRTGADLFDELNGVTVTNNATSGVEKFDEFVGASGVKLTAQKNGASFEIAPSLSGTFGMDFRVYSDETFDGENNDCVDENASVNTAVEVSELIFTITDNITGESVYAFFEGANSYAVSIPSVKAGLEKASNKCTGYKYKSYSDKAAEQKAIANGESLPFQDTKLKRAGSGYNSTILYGTSFSNNALLGKPSTAYSTNTDFVTVTKNGDDILREANAGYPNYIGFDPETKKVYSRFGGNYAKNPQLVEVLDFNDEECLAAIGGGKLVGTFENYSVKVEFSAIASGKDNAKMVVYTINGQNLGGETLTENDGGTQAAPFIGDYVSFDAVAGGIYLIEKPYCYDIVDGEVEFNGQVRATDLAGNAVKIYNAAGAVVSLGKSVEYSDGMYLKTTGNVSGYRVYYKNFKDKSGNAAKEAYLTVNMTKAKPSSSSAFTDGYVDGGSYTVKTGLRLNVGGYGNSSIAKNGRSCPLTLTVEKDGETLSGYDGKRVGKDEYIVPETGEYKFTYEMTDSTGNSVIKSFTVNATSIDITLNAEETSIVSIGSAMNISAADITAKSGDTSVEEVIITVSYNGSEFVALSDMSFDEEGKYEIKYTAKSGNDKNSVIRTVYLSDTTYIAITPTEDAFENFALTENGAIKALTGTVIDLPKIRATVNGEETDNVAVKLVTENGVFVVTGDKVALPSKAGNCRLVYTAGSGSAQSAYACAIDVREFWLEVSSDYDFSKVDTNALFSVKDVSVRDFNGNAINGCKKIITVAVNGRTLLAADEYKFTESGNYTVKIGARLGKELSDEKVFSFIVEDKTAPSGLPADTKVTKIVGQTYIFPEIANQNGVTVTVKITYEGEELPIRGDAVKLEKSGKYYVTFALTDENGNTATSVTEINSVSLVIPIAIGAAVIIVAGVAVAVVISKKRKN